MRTNLRKLGSLIIGAAAVYITLATVLMSLMFSFGAPEWTGRDEPGELLSLYTLWCSVFLLWYLTVVLWRGSLRRRKRDA